MYTQQLSLYWKEEAEQDVYDQLQHFLGTLRKGGQIIGKAYPIIKKEEHFEVLVMTLEVGALEEQNDSIYTKIFRETFKNNLSITLLGSNDLESNLCTCKMPTSYILYTDYLKISSPLHCGACFGEVPLYHLGVKEGYDAILSWESNYVACDTLQMNCAVGEAFGMDQMSNLDSELNQLGLKCCQEIERLTKKPSYYYLYNYQATSIVEDQKRVCPSCDQTWFLQEQFLDRFDFKCTTCNLLSDISSYQS